jgi:homoaconitase/3-isopropylmalate dehydratase large subunit
MRQKVSKQKEIKMDNEATYIRNLNAEIAHTEKSAREDQKYKQIVEVEDDEGDIITITSYNYGR